jgi:membrane associated rhomboid family serine protease
MAFNCIFGARPNGRPGMITYLTYIIIAVTVITSYRAFHDMHLQQRMLFNPYLVDTEKDYLRLLSAGFIHADWLHLIINMYVLYMFGEITEYKFHNTFGPWGGLFYVILYVAGIMASQMISFFRHRRDPHYNSLGASGAVSAVVFSAILFLPTFKIYFIFLPGIGIPAWIFGLLYLVYCQYMSLRGGGRINHDAHFSGAVFGFLFTGLLRPALFGNFIEQIIA